MRAVKRWRYYCEHCKKSGAQRPRMEKHEAGCCHNPGRTCGMCNVMQLVQKPLPELRAVLERGDLDALKHEAENCPSCILATLLYTKKALTAEGVSDEDLPWFEFDAKAAFADAWKEINASQREDSGW